MALLDDKKNVFTTIGSYVSFMQRTASQVDEIYNMYPSINNKNDVVPFLLDTLKTTVGTDALKELIGELFTKIVDKIEPQIREVLKKQLTQVNAGNAMPTFFDAAGAGIDIPVNRIDRRGKLRENPNSEVGSLLYGAAETFDRRAHEAISMEGTSINYCGLSITFNSATDSFNLKSAIAAPSIGEWIGNYIDNTVIIDKKEFLTNVMNAVYGSVTANQDKTVEQVYQEMQISKIIEQLIEDNDSFEITQDDFDALLQQAQALVDGVVYYDMGCGMIGAQLPFDDMVALISQISGSTDSYATGNAVADTIDKSTENVQDVADENKQTIKDGFFQRIIKMIQQMLAEIATTSPQIQALKAIISMFEKGVLTAQDTIEDLKNYKIFMKCIIKEIMKTINEFIFKLVVSYLIALLLPIVKKIIQEKITQYTGIVKSLITG